MPIYKMDGKKDGKQQYRVRINYTDIFGRRKQIDRIAYGSGEAKLLEMKLLNEIKDGPASSSKPLNELYEEYIASKKHEVRATSLDKSKRILNLYVLPELGSYKIDKLTIPVLQHWKDGMNERSIGTRTKQGAYSEFRTLLNFAVKMTYLPQNPLPLVGNFKDANFEMQQEKLHYYTVEQWTRFVAAAKPQTNSLLDWGYYVFFNIAFYTGMRKGEINALKWSDIDGTVIHVRRSIAQKVKGADIETPPKNRSSYRDIQMPIPLITILKEHKDRQRLDERFTDDYRVCGGISCLRDTSISNKNIQFATKAGVPVIRIHDFRHTHASLLVNEGINIQEIARRLGHSNIEMTWNTYSHLYPREEERALTILNKIV